MAPLDFADQIHQIHAGDPWYGDPITTVARDVTAGDAAAHPIRGAHSIWELVLHLATWVSEVRRRLADGVWREPEDGDWPSVAEPTEANWQRDLVRLSAAHEELRQAIAAFPAQRLGEQIGTERNRALGTGVTYQEMLHGILQHDTYHLGQIVMLKRALDGATRT